MTTLLRDLSHYDSSIDLTGFAGCTHKITEGTSYLDPMYAPRMPGLRAPNRVLGSYHVLHTGDLAAQLDFWVTQQDRLTPWWRDWPHWIMQIDAEKWPNDPVTLPDGRTHTGPLHLIAHLLHPDHHAELLAARVSTTVAFAGMLVGAGLPGWKITYASRGQYGDSLAGLATPLWNANYGPNDGTYPGDTSSRWDAYSDQTPVLLQFTSIPYDKSAFRGTPDQLLALIEGDTPAVKQYVLYQVADHTWTYLSDGMSRRFVGDRSQFGNYVQNHGYLAGLLDSLTPIVCGVQDLDTLAGPCVAGPDPATTGTLDDIRAHYASQVALTADQFAQLEAAVGPIVRGELAKVGVTLTVGA